MPGFHTPIKVYHMLANLQQVKVPYYLNKTEDYVKKLVEEAQANLLIQGRNISMDRLYTSISLANWLL